MRRIMSAALAALLAIPPSTSSADLIFDGVPGETGDEVGTSISTLMDAFSQFFSSLAAWEMRTSDGIKMEPDIRMLMSEQRFGNFMTLLDRSQSSLTQIRDMIALGKLDNISLEKSPRQLSPDLSVTSEDILGESGYAAPETYLDAVDIALAEIAAIKQTASRGFSDQTDDFRGTVFNVSWRIHKATIVGLAVGSYMPTYQ